ncbi:hypothetical protein BH24ACT9_BH24ACT9_06700 [soil metagenome]
MSQPDEHDSTAPPQTGAQTQAQPEQTGGYGYADQGGYAGPPGYADQGGYAGPPGYPAPGYGAGAQPPPGYPPNPGYPAPYGYQSYGYPAQRGPQRPGGATASAVLMFIQGGLVLFATLYVLFFASVASGISSAGVSEADSLETEWTIIGILQLVSVGLLIFGGVQTLGGGGRIVTIVACGSQVALTLYWMIRIGSLPEFGDDGGPFLFVVPLFYAVLPVVALSLALGRPVTEYIVAKQALRTAAA